MQADHIARVIFDYAGKIGNIRETGEFLQLNADMARDLVSADRCSIWLVDPAKHELWTTVAHGLAEQGLRELRIPAGQGIVGAAIEADESVVVNDTSQDPRFLRTSATGGYETKSLLVIPLHGPEGQVIGALQAINKPGGFAREDVELLALAASSVANALETQRLRNEAETARLIQKEIEIASGVQRRLLPQNPPKIAGIDYAAFCRPAKGVGGDYYDFIPMTDGGLMITLGDVSGKGIAAAVLMASIQASIRSQCVNPPASIAKLMEEFNRAIFSFSTADKYSTLFVARLDGTRRRLTYVNAGQVRPLVLRAGGATEELAAGGMPVGLLPQVSYDQGEIDLEEGDMIVACSDGVTEAMNPNDDMWEDADLEKVLRANTSLSATEVIQRVMTAVDEFANGAEQSDDITVSVMRFVAA
jgi:sigma-B regulation protein RsbU (phosphoserine phosphatase)